MLLCLFIGLASCTKPDPLYHTQSYVFGTLVDVSIYGEEGGEAQNIVSQILREFQKINNRYHAWHPSELSGINHAFLKGKSTVTVKQDMADMMQNLVGYAEITEGFFNPSIGVLLELWGFQSDDFKPVKVSAEDIAYIVKLNPQMTDLDIDGNKISSNNVAFQLDLGGYAKGYALDQAMLILKKHGVKNALINIGGNVIALGKHGDKPWRVGIQHPRQPNAIASLDLDSGWAIGTSGDYQRFFYLEGKRYCHIIDPRTGYPAQGMQSATVLIAPREDAGALSDVTSKPFFIDGAANAARHAQRMGVENVLMIDDKGSIYATRAMQKRLKWTDAKPPVVHTIQ